MSLPAVDAEASYTFVPLLDGALAAILRPRMTIVIAIFALGLLIVVHEYGHYIVARWCGMHVERFSVGFGPPLIKWVSKKTGTIFQLAPLPFGGFAQIRGMNVVEEIDPQDRTAYPNRPTWQRMAAIFAGPAANYLTAVVLALALYSFHGMNSFERWFGVAGVSANYDVAGKLEPGDRILAIDGEALWLRSPTGQRDVLRERVSAKGGQPVTLTVQRSGTSLDIKVQPKKLMTFGILPALDRHGKPQYLLGISYAEQADVRPAGVGGAIVAAVRYPVDQTRQLLAMFGSILSGKEKAEFGGPVRITEEFKKSIEAGWVTFLMLLMGLNVYLGLFNLLPLPALDGGRLAFLGYELLTRRRPNARIEATVHMAGILVLLVLLVVVTFGDIKRLFV